MRRMSSAGPGRFEYLTPETVAACEDLEVVAKGIVEGFFAGLHRSPWHGFNVEFSEYRPYAPGDPPKFVDWGVYGRTDRFLIRESQEETNCRATILLDATASLDFPSAASSKFRYASCLAAAIAWILCRQRDAVGLGILAGGIAKYLPPRTGEAALREVLRALEAARPRGETDFDALLSLADELPRRGLVILLTDFYADERGAARLFQKMRHLRHEVLALHLLSPEERDFPYRGLAEFRDLEGAGSLETEADFLRPLYREALSAWTQSLARAAASASAFYRTVFTDRPFAESLREFLAARGRWR